MAYRKRRTFRARRSRRRSFRRSRRRSYAKQRSTPRTYREIGFRM
jgi:hypothetical protein